MMMITTATILFMCLGGTLADISGSNPPTGSCLCGDGSSINVRQTACGTVIGSISSSDCFEYLGSKETCDLSGVSYEYFELDYGSSGGWVAGDYLVNAADSACNPGGGGCPNIVSRSEWGAVPPTSVTPISQPVPMVFIHHTAGNPCYTQAECSQEVRNIQSYHMNTNGWSDIGYNFLIGEDGNAYEGRGWDARGAHASDYNSVSIGMSVMGTFTDRLPNAAALTALQQLIDCGLANGVSSSYTHHGHRDGGCTECPGQMLYNEIITWPNYGGFLSGCALEESQEFVPQQ